MQELVLIEEHALVAGESSVAFSGTLSSNFTNYFERDVFTGSSLTDHFCCCPVPKEVQYVYMWHRHVYWWQCDKILALQLILKLGRELGKLSMFLYMVFKCIDILSCRGKDFMLVIHKFLHVTVKQSTALPQNESQKSGWIQEGKFCPVIIGEPPFDVLHFITSLGRNIIKCEIFILRATNCVHVTNLY